MAAWRRFAPVKEALPSIAHTERGQTGQLVAMCAAKGPNLDLEPSERRLYVEARV